jgi:hypothetical protein
MDSTVPRFFPNPSMREATALAAPVCLAVLALAGAGCGGGNARSAATAGPASSSAAGAGAGIPVNAAPAPVGWHAARIPIGAVLSYPPGWRPAHGDVGTATAVMSDARGQLIGYLNVTPRQAGEKLLVWASFRIRHNMREGDRAVTREAVAHDVRFLNGTGACVRDSYTTSSGARYTEIACLVRGPGGKASVIVGSAPPRDWARIGPLIYRALGAFTT